MSIEKSFLGDRAVLRRALIATQRLHRMEPDELKINHFTAPSTKENMFGLQKILKGFSFRRI